MLRIENIRAGYHDAVVLHGVSFEVMPGEVTTIVGRNGSGRSTTLKVIAGVLAAKSGRIEFDGYPLSGLRADQVSNRGIAYIPEDREIFPNLTVEENLRVGVRRRRNVEEAWTIDRVWSTFPRLFERRGIRAVSLSGGEQQMLAMCRGLLGNPRAILIDEPTEGLAPKIVEQVRDLIVALREQGLAIVLVEQKLSFALTISDKVLIMGHGEIVFTGTPGQFAQADELRRLWLEV